MRVDGRIREGCKYAILLIGDTVEDDILICEKKNEDLVSFAFCNKKDCPNFEEDSEG